MTERPNRGDAPVPPRKNTGKIALAVVGGLLGLCCVGAVISSGDDDTAPEDAAVPASAPAAAVAATTSAPAPSATTVAPEPTATSATATTPPAPRTATVPDLKGENAAVADDTLRKLGFTNIRFGSADEDDKVVLLLANWTVTKQSAKAGRKLPLDTLIVLTCTKQ